MSNTKHTSLSGSSAKRLPRYFRYLRALLINGVMKTSSCEIAKGLGITPSQVRSDLNRFEGAGQQGYGYNVKTLYTEISLELGAGDKLTAVIIGGDPAFSARLTRLFEGRGVTVTASFFENTEPCPNGIKAYLYTQIAEQLLSSPADIAVIADMLRGFDANELPKLGIKGIWNMTQTDINVGVPTVNLPLGDILMGLCREIHEMKFGEKGNGI